MLQEYLDAMRIDEATTVLDMGCGTGVAARAIARRPGFAGKVTGVDPSPYLVKAAARLAGEEDIADRVEFRAIRDASTFQTGRSVPWLPTPC